MAALTSGSPDPGARAGSAWHQAEAGRGGRGQAVLLGGAGGPLGRGPDRWQISSSPALQEALGPTGRGQRPWARCYWVWRRDGAGIQGGMAWNAGGSVCPRGRCARRGGTLGAPRLLSPGSPAIALGWESLGRAPSEPAVHTAGPLAARHPLPHPLPAVSLALFLGVAEALPSSSTTDSARRGRDPAWPGWRSRPNPAPVPERGRCYRNRATKGRGRRHAAGWGGVLWGPGRQHRAGRAAAPSGRQSACPDAALPGRGPAGQDARRQGAAESQPHPRPSRLPRSCHGNRRGPSGPGRGHPATEARGRQAGPVAPSPPRQVRPCPRGVPGGQTPGAGSRRPAPAAGQWASGQPGGRGGRGGRGGGSGCGGETGARGERGATGRTDHGLQVPQVRQDRVLR